MYRLGFCFGGVCVVFVIFFVCVFCFLGVNVVMVWFYLYIIFVWRGVWFGIKIEAGGSFS